MRVISVGMLRTFWRRHRSAEQPLKAWYDEAKSAGWSTPEDIKARYGSASFLANNRVVFNIKGNEFRLVVAVAYRFEAVYIKFIGTHAQYDKVDAATVEDT
jgi:mRNA interferase HigB